MQVCCCWPRCSFWQWLHSLELGWRGPGGIPGWGFHLHRAWSSTDLHDASRYYIQGNGEVILCLLPVLGNIYWGFFGDMFPKPMLPRQGRQWELGVRSGAVHLGCSSQLSSSLHSSRLAWTCGVWEVIPAPAHPLPSGCGQQVMESPVPLAEGMGSWGTGSHPVKGQKS